MSSPETFQLQNSELLLRQANALKEQAYAGYTLVGVLLSENNVDAAYAEMDTALSLERQAVAVFGQYEMVIQKHKIESEPRSELTIDVVDYTVDPRPQDEHIVEKAQAKPEEFALIPVQTEIVPQDDEEEMIIVGIVIPGNRQKLQMFTAEAVASAREDQWTALSALLDYKVIAPIKDLMKIGTFLKEEQSAILQKIRTTITDEIHSHRFSYSNEYEDLSSWAEQIFHGELFELYETKIYSYIYRRTSDQVLSEDLTDQVFLKMLEALRVNNAWKTSFSGWLYRIAHNLVIDHYRARDRQKSVSIDDIPHMPDTNQNPVRATEITLDAEELRAAMRRLTDEQAQVLSLRFLEGYSFGEIAEMMDKSEGAVKALQHRAVATLRILLGAERLSV